MADPRHVRRIKAVQNLFALSFVNNPAHKPNDEEEISPLVLENGKQIDELITKYAPKYPIDRIAKIDLAILRLAVYELVIEASEPPKVIIDEAVTLAKEFGGDRSYAFINAVLGAIYKTLPQQEDDDTKPNPDA